MIKVLDNPFYYLDNFQLVLDWIDERYSDLLADEELAFIDAFRALPQASRALFVRMVMRKGRLFRASKLSYAEIGCTRAAAEPLLATGWIGADPAITLDQLFDIVSKPEIALIFGQALTGKATRKAEQLAALRHQFGDARPFSAWFRDAGDALFEIHAKPLCDRLRLIFFGNAHQDWLEFVLSDLGVYRYEKVEFSRASRGFRTRRDVDDYLHLQHCRDRLAAGTPVHEVARELPAGPYDNDWLDGRRERLLFQLAQQLEKDRDWDGALPLYMRCTVSDARARAIRVLEKLERFAEAQALLTAAQGAPHSEAERQQLLRMAPRLARRLGQAPQAKARKTPVRRIELALPMPREDYVVESVVCAHLARPDAPVFYVENTLINALFGLLCWDAVFAAVPGAFFHPFHRGPADLMNTDFHRRREAEFARCLARLDGDGYRAAILANFACKAGIQSPFVAWDSLNRDLIEMALDCIPAVHLKQWCERILLDIKANCCGFPDLVQFFPSERRYDMIEVKAPGDRLQDSQLRWIDYCVAHAMPVAVCYLRWAGEHA